MLNNQPADKENKKARESTADQKSSTPAGCANNYDTWRILPQDLRPACAICKERVFNDFRMSL